MSKARRVTKPGKRKIAAEKAAMPDDLFDLWLQTRFDGRALVASLSGLEGFLTALVVGPVLPDLFASIFAGLGLGPDAHEDGSTPEFAALSAAVVHYNRLTDIMVEAPERFNPRFTVKAGGGVDPGPWCQGFYSAVELNRELWKPVLGDDDHPHPWLWPVLVHCTDKQGQPLLGPTGPGTEVDRLLKRDARQEIRANINALRHHHRVKYYD